MKKRIQISGMSCGHCVKRVENALRAIEGVESVTVDLEDNSAIVESNGHIEEQWFKAAIDDAGYEVEAVQDLL